ncbi:hypothetical protein CEXT_85481 [Caerostris extrusa]|uniref:Uncharacterized protein n=1 Tax=Caerostris extrusa TaxID=172846 RepID=A0AAV4RH42_CAEEX|nr:hypothetical protein CEXT_85481 [Caerostris extrusa]
MVNGRMWVGREMPRACPSMSIRSKDPFDGHGSVNVRSVQFERVINPLAKMDVVFRTDNPIASAYRHIGKSMTQTSLCRELHALTVT